MKVFVAYGFNDRDKWVEELVFPLIGAFGDELADGSVTRISGTKIPDGVIAGIRGSQAILGFLTRRVDPQGALTASTHWWVLQELGIAAASERPPLVLPIREEGLEPQQGITGAYPGIEYKPAERDRCIVEIVKILGEWHRATSVRLQLLPEQYASELRPLLNKPDLRVQCQLLIRGDEGPLTDTKVVPIKGGLFVDLRHVPRDALVRLQVQCQGRIWTSDYESMDSIGIHLTKQ